MTPTKAYYKAREEGPEDLTRNVACQDAYHAYLYARHVDKQPSKQTAQDHSRYPHTCPHCGNAAYIPLMGTPECSENCNK